MMSKTTILLLVGVFALFMLSPNPDGKSSLLVSVFPDAFGQLPVLNVTTGIDAPPNPTCYELGTCDVFASPLDAMLEPFFCSFSFGEEVQTGESCSTGSGQIFLVVIWGLIIGVIWLRTSSTMMTGVVGIGIATIFTFSEKTIFIGITLLILAVGIVIYQLYKQRLDFPSN